LSIVHDLHPDVIPIVKSGEESLNPGHCAADVFFAFERSDGNGEFRQACVFGQGRDGKTAALDLDTVTQSDQGYENDPVGLGR
jgi:hypothetical protein